MRTTNHYGMTCGAAVVELRRGSVHHVDFGTVERFPADEVPIRGGAVLRFRPTATIAGNRARDLADKLGAISLACARGEITMQERAERFDDAIGLS